MTHFSIKKVLSSSLLFVPSLFGFQSGFQTHFEARGVATQDGIRGHRNRFILEQRYSNDLIQIQGSVRAQTEGIAVQDHSLVDIRDLFLGWKRAAFSIKAGWQQVVWGEAFGFYFADMVNPKDLSEFGLGDLEANRLTIPMLNLKYIFFSSSFQMVLIPVPMLSRIAVEGSQFAFPFQSAFGELPINVSADRTPASHGTDYGARMTHILGALNLAAFYFNGLDRNPPFISQFGSPIQITRSIYQLQTVGLSSSAEMNGGSIVRTEFLFRPNQQYQIAGPLGLLGEESATWVGVVGWDVPLENLQLGFQASSNYRTHFIDFAGPSIKEQLSVRVAGTTKSQLDWELVATYLPHDGSTLMQPRISIPLSPQMELSLSSAIFLGGDASDFGHFTRASRIAAEFRAHLKG